jgi:hypothetical protein
MNRKFSTFKTKYLNLEKHGPRTDAFLIFDINVGTCAVARGPTNVTVHRHVVRHVSA